MNRRTVITVVIVFIVILLGIGLFNAIIQSTRGAAPKLTPPPIATPAPVSVLDTLNSDDSEIRMTVLGRIIAKESHIDETISISKSRRNIYYVRAYSGTAEPNISFDNNAPAYEDFVRALNKAGFTATQVQKKDAPKPADTEIGLCPNGQRYIYEIIKGGQSIYRAWSTTCGDATTFGGNPGTIRNLIILQIPNYNKIVGGVR